MTPRQARFYALQAIDEAAGLARQQFATSAPLQDTIYRLKLDQAEAYKKAHAIAPTAEVPPYVLVEAEENDLSPIAAANQIIAQASMLATVAGPTIERRRTRGKRAVNQAFNGAGTDEERIAAMFAARDAAIVQLQQPVS